jgi:PAS domain S-box-containing protein
MVEPIVESSTETVLNVAKAEAIRVLQVDDDQVFLKVAKQCLETQGEFEVDTASSINEALEKLKKTDYDVIVSDYQMPSKDGFEFLKELREKGNIVPFIVFTGKGREEIAMKALNLGASGYFTKQGQPETVYGELAHGIRQVTERKKTETTMWEREERLRAVFSSSPDAIAVSDLHGNIIDCSEAAWKMLGFSSMEELIGKSSFDFIAEKDRQEALENLTKTLEQGTARNVEYVLLNKNGEKFWGELSASIVKDLLGNPVGFVGVIRDVSERKKAEQTLKESEEKYRSLVELAPDGIVAVNVEGIVTSANRSFLRLLGYDSEEEIVGKPFTELKTSRVEDIPKFQEMFMSLMKGESPSPVEFLYVRRDGTIRWAEVHPGLLTKEGNPVGAQVIMRDVTERKKVEKTLQESEERFKAIFEGANDGILAADTKTRRISFANPRICEITGYSSEELLKLGVGDINPKKDLPYVIDSFEKQRQGKVALSKDIPVLRKDGRVVYCDVSSKPMKIGSQEYLVGFFRDVTEHRKAEEERREVMEKLQMMNEKLRVVGGLTRHDVNNKLAAITGNAYLARKKLPGNSEVLDYLKQIEASVKQTVQIFDFARAYEMLGVEELVHVDVEKSVNEAISLFPDLKDIKVMNDCHGLTVLADSLLRQLFYNLIDNSLKYGEKLSWTRVYYEDKNDHLNLTYEDDGVGIPQAAKPKLFGEGYTTGKGSGYGLFLVKRMMEVYGWTIQETGTQGTGAQFTISIPRTNKEGKENYRLS